MKAILALVFFACIAGSMANTPSDIVNLITQQGQAIAQTIFGQLQNQVSSLLQGTFGQLAALIGSLGGRVAFNLDDILAQLQALAGSVINAGLTSVLGSLSGLIGGK